MKIYRLDHSLGPTHVKSGRRKWPWNVFVESGRGKRHSPEALPLVSEVAYPSIAW